jgi:hypothetical protein
MNATAQEKSCLQVSNLHKFVKLSKILICGWYRGWLKFQPTPLLYNLYGIEKKPSSSQAHSGANQNQSEVKAKVPGKQLT